MNNFSYAWINVITRTFSWWDSIALITSVFTFHFSNNYQILFLYSKGMSTRDIQKTIYQMFYCDLDKDTISRITDKIIPEIVMWKQRPL